MQLTSTLLKALNYYADIDYLGESGIVSATASPIGLPIQSIGSYLKDVSYLWPDGDDQCDPPGNVGNGTYHCDDIVSADHQAIRQNIEPLHLPNLSLFLTDVGNPFSWLDTNILFNGDCYVGGQYGLPVGRILHFGKCLGDQGQTQTKVYNLITPSVLGQASQLAVQITLDGGTGPISYDLFGPFGTFYHETSGVPLKWVVPGQWTLANVVGPSANYTVSPSATQTIGWDPVSQANNWTIVFSIDFVSTPPAAPTVSVSAPSGLAGDGATLNGTVNPNGSSTTAWFDYSTSSTLASFQSTPSQSVGAGTIAQAFNYSLSGLSSNTTYYYRAAASNAAGIVRGNTILSFTTLSTLPRPTLLSPASGATGISTTPTLTWSTVANATSYRLMVATNLAALPTDPTSKICGAGCVLNVTPTEASYTPVAGTLAPGTIYYWEVHARSPLQFGDWSIVFSFTTAVNGPPSDFSVQVTPASQSVILGGSASYLVSTTTTSGTAQTITLSAGNLPAGVTASFSPNVLTSGNASTLTLTASPSTAAGSYGIAVLASGSANVTHTTSATLVVNTNSGTPAVAFSPASLAFSDQTQYTTGPSQLVTYTNTGTAPLQVWAIVGDNNFVVQNPCINTLPPGTSCTFSVASDPSITGPMTGTAGLYFVGTGSPAVLPLRGNGLAPPPTSGTIQVNAVVNGLSYPGSIQYTLAGPSPINGFYTPSTFTVTGGSYTLTLTGSGYLTLTGITPSSTQIVNNGGVTTFTMNFTASNDFLVPVFIGNFTSQIVPAGATANYTVNVGLPPDNVSSSITLQAFGVPPGASASFNPQPVNSGSNSVLTVTTSPTTPLGAYVLSLIGTNVNGLTHVGGNMTSLVLTAPPLQPTQLASTDGSGIQGNGASGGAFTTGGISGDGRLVVLPSSATNLVPNDNNGFRDIFVKDRQTGTTTNASVATDGTEADFGSFLPAISLDGRYVVFHTPADNLVPGGAVFANAIYVRDLQLNATERADLAYDGTPANADSCCAAISGDGRFVAFQSRASNLIVGGTNGQKQVYVRDRKTAQTTIVSTSSAGTQGNQASDFPAISADGRFVAFASDSSNLVPIDTNGQSDIFVRDLQTGQTALASIASDGTQGNRLVFTQSAPAISADGRYVAFMTSATNLVPSPTDGAWFHVYLRDLLTGQTSLVDSDTYGVPLAGEFSFQNPAISADGRFVSYTPFSQVLVRDTHSNQTLALSIASDGTVANNLSYSSAMSAGGGFISYSSDATNLVASDVNSATDEFVVANPLLVSPYVTSLTLNASTASGGSSITGTVILSGPAPTGGAVVALSSNNSLAPVPAWVTVPAGSTSSVFSFNTLFPTTETVMTLIASYNGGSAVALLTLEPAPALTVAPSSWDFGSQPVGTTSAASVFAISNTGTATLTLNSEIVAGGQVFHMTANSCGATLAAGANCSVSVVFSPTTAGPTADTLQISYSSPPVVQSVPLAGTGTTPLVSLAPFTVNFGSQPIPSATPATVTLTNVGTAPLTSIAASITGLNTTDFSVSSDGCSGTVLQPNSSCLITVVFSPQAAGLRSANLSVNDNAVGSPQTVALSGTGAIPLTVSPTALSYGNQGISSTSAAKKVTLTNNTGAVVTISSMAISGTDSADFAQSATTCGATLALTASCTVSITFTPTASGARSATLILTDSAVNSPQTVALSGTGVLQVTLSSTTLAFGNQADGSTSAPKTVTLTNNTSAALAISSVAITGTNAGEFAVSSNTCGSSVGGHSSCKISVTFAPVTTGAKTAALTITDSANNSPQLVNLTGTGIVPVSVTPSSVTFPARAVGTTSPAKKITVKNNLPTTLTISGITFTGTNPGDFGQSVNTCGPTLAAGASCTVGITFTPTAKGSRVAVLDVSDSASTSPQTVSLSGKGK